MQVTDEMLLPCPFCGASPHYSERRDEDLATHDIVIWRRVSCLNCDAAQECPDGYEDGSAIERWNRRAALAHGGEAEPVACPHDCYIGRPGDCDGSCLHPAPQPSVSVKALKAAEKALRPFYDAVFNDNGDLTVTGFFEHDEVVAGYFAYQKVEAALSALSAEQPVAWDTIVKKYTEGEWTKRCNAVPTSVVIQHIKELVEELRVAAPTAGGEDA